MVRDAAILSSFSHKIPKYSYLFGKPYKVKADNICFDRAIEQYIWQMSASYGTWINWPGMLAQGCIYVGLDRIGLYQDIYEDQL